jgi:hypothetical protein
MENPFTDEEVKKIRALLPYAEVVTAEAEYDAAKKLIIRRWKGIIIGLAAVVGALMILWTQLKHFVQSVAGS